MQPPFTQSHAVFEVQEAEVEPWQTAEQLLVVELQVQPVDETQEVDVNCWLQPVVHKPPTHMHDVVDPHVSLLVTFEQLSVQRELTTSHWHLESALQSALLEYSKLQRVVQLDPTSWQAACWLQVAELLISQLTTQAEDEADHMHWASLLQSVEVL